MATPRQHLSSSRLQLRAALLLALLPFCSQGVRAQAPAPSPVGAVVQVRSEEQLLAALPLGRPILVLESIFLNQSLPVITSEVTISGDPVSCRTLKHGYCRIDCKRSCRQFTVEAGGKLTLTNIMIARGQAPSTENVGGAILIRNSGQVTAQTVIFRFNGAPGATSGGGAVEVETGGTLFVRSCLFLRNYAGFGGAVAGAKNANIVIASSFFNRNTALTAGGAVSLVLNSTANLNGNDYHLNTAAIGGAIQLDDSSATICRGWEHANNATVMGPQVYAANFARVFACQLPFSYVTVLSGASVTQNCAFCQ